MCQVLRLRDSERLREMEQQGKGMMMKKKVMVAIDESELSHYALEWTLENLGNTIHNSELVVFTAQPTAIDLGCTNNNLDEFCFSY